jgi:FAD/FMN-containing dehydrogenase
LVIDISAIKSVKVSDDKKTVTFGGGIPSVELVEALEKEGLTIPFGNTGFVGYVGWVTMGGYGPLTKSLGMGFEGIVGAELVTADGAIIKATEEILEGLRGMGGNLGVVTSMTVKTHPARKVTTQKANRSNVLTTQAG